MKLYEYQGKEILRDHALQLVRSALIRDYAEVDRILQGWKRVDLFMVKAQILEGKRGKRGLVKEADRNSLKKVCKGMLRKKVNNKKIKYLLIEKKQYIREEHYLSITIDRENREYRLIYSPKGGIDIEDQKKYVKYINFYEFDDRAMKKITRDPDIREIARVLFSIFKKYDATLVEINPLAYTVNGFRPIDCKIELDDNARFRWKSFKDVQNESGTAIEQRAKKKGIQYVDLDLHGDIGVIGNGAGLVMATLDTIANYGGKPANFLDLGGGTDASVMEESMNLVMASEPCGLLISIFGGMTHCDEVAQGLLSYKKKYSLHLPVVVRITGTKEDEAKKLLKDAGIYIVDTLDDAAKKIISLVKHK